MASGAGGAGRASADDGDNVWLNPAAMVHGSVFASSLAYSAGETDDGEKDRVSSITISDNGRDIFFSGGFGYANRKRTFENLPTLEEQYYQISLGKFVAKHLALGASVFFLESDVAGDRRYEQWDGHFGVHYNPHPDYGYGLVFYNLGARDETVPRYIQNLDKVAAGVHGIFLKYFRVRADLSQVLQENPDHRQQYQVGLESRLAPYFLMRFGVDKDDLAGRKFFTAGASFDGPRIKIDYYFKHNTGMEASGAMHGVDIRLPFW